ncbi:23S rRNA (adenine(2030)-N(6))-methyltransferase RlmJ, partial [Oxalobacter sp. OttesenSCG-928-P03]|nr:23S rRNA (adenine(2030)-N(6))-methyltransferase RlmJ [Oxalobacter sp. OttesenSCG-928-P03]
MFSYRHAFHAGNHADVLKHVVLLAVLQYACQKEAAVFYIDTHAGAGLYALHRSEAQKNREFETG